MNMLPVTSYQTYINLISISNAALQLQAVLRICFHVAAGITAFMCILDHFNLGRRTAIKTYLLIAQLFIVIFSIVTSTVDMIETFYYNSVYLTIINMLSYAMVNNGIVMIQVTMLRRSLILSGYTNCMTVLVTIYAIVLASIAILFDISILKSCFPTWFNAWFNAKLYSMNNSIMIMGLALNFVVNCTGNTFLFLYYYRQRSTGESRRKFIDRILDKRLRSALFAAFVETSNITIFALLMTGHIWAPEGSVYILAATLQCKSLLLFIDEDLDVTVLTHTTTSS